MAEIDEGKYITFKREEFFKMIGLWTTKWMRTVEIPLIVGECEEITLTDAVIIRRQDKFASPCLLTYAAMISMVASEQKELWRKNELQAIADYFHDQGILAGDEGFKLPDL